MTLKQVLEHKPTDATSLIHSIQAVQTEIGSWNAQGSHQTTRNLFFDYP